MWQLLKAMKRQLVSVAARRARGWQTRARWGPCRRSTRPTSTGASAACPSFW
ncbi:uncharacterized protein M6B38_116365 [Iris pallida]|uniref:Uncharacterized protein n=1 Tax=Iris pallida TaxID=29817 RepID=A0AAX6I5G9_IRIPA|nr:uncharacterized protein M6B38_116365 [Iris pallida]